MKLFTNHNDAADEGPTDTVEIAAYLTTRDLERLLQVDKRTLQRLWKKGDLPYPSKIGGSNRWRANAISAALSAIDCRAGGDVREEEGGETDDQPHEV